RLDRAARGSAGPIPRVADEPRGRRPRRLRLAGCRRAAIAGRRWAAGDRPDLLLRVPGALDRRGPGAAPARTPRRGPGRIGPRARDRARALTRHSATRGL